MNTGRDRLGRFIKGQQLFPEYAFKKGVRSSPLTEFKKGHIPWIKGRHQTEEAKRAKEKITLSQEELASLYKANSLSKLAEILGVERKTITRTLKRHGGLLVKREARNRNCISGKQHYRYNPKIHTNEMITCRCGCGALLTKYDRKGRRHYSIRGHEVWKNVLRRKIPNRQEIFLINLFQEHNLPYRYVGNGQVILGNKNPDFINTNGQKKVIEFFGEYWHKPEDEEIKREIYQQYGFSMLVIWGKELKNKDSLLAKILAFEKKT